MVLTSGSGTGIISCNQTSWYQMETITLDSRTASTITVTEIAG